MIYVQNENTVNASENGIDKGTLVCSCENMASQAETYLQQGKEEHGFEYQAEFDSWVADMCEGEWVL